MSEEDFDDEQTVGLALGFRIIEDGGKLFLAEAEIAPYVDSPAELGVTLVFHPLHGLDPIELDDEINWPSWPLDIDDHLDRDGEAPMVEQFQQVVTQLRALDEGTLRKYLSQAREEAEE